MASENKPDLPFSTSSYEDWLAVARQELGGADPTKKLALLKGSLEISPFYVTPQTETQDSPLLKPSSQPHSGARNWVNTTKIIVSDDKVANEIALSHLNSGAEGILFDPQSLDLNSIILLNNISLIDCSVSFLINQKSVDWLNDFRQYAENNFDKTEISGSLFWSTTECEADVITAFSNWPKFHSLGIIVHPHQDASDEIAQALLRTIELVDSLSEQKISIQTMLDQISFSVSVGPDFFLEIAKLKSLRKLWHQVRHAYKVSFRPLHILAESKAWTKEDYHPHENMIKATTSAMSAIAGGCDSLMVAPEDENHDTMSRIAINVSSILREESHFSKVADPTAGSFYVDSLTHQLSEKAWTKFQSLVK